MKSASTEQVDEAVENARAAFPAWAAAPWAKRAKALNSLADLIDEYTEEIAYCESVASGRPISNVKFEMPMVTAVLRCTFPVGPAIAVRSSVSG